MTKRITFFAIVLTAVFFLQNCGSNIDMLISDLYSKDKRPAAVTALSKTEPAKTFSRVYSVLGSHDDDTANGAIEIMKAWKDKGVVEMIQKAMDETINIKEARNSVRALAAIGGENAEDILISHINDERLEVGFEALNGLGILGSKKSVGEIIKIVSADKINDPRLPIALLALGKIKEPSAVPALEEMLSKDISSYTLKINLINTIFEIEPLRGYEITKAELGTLSSSDPRYIVSVLNLLEKAGQKDCVEKLTALKKDLPGMADRIDKVIEAAKQR